MDIVSRPEMSPGHCMFSLKSEDPLGFIDTGLSPACVDPRVYASVSVVREYATKLGMVDGDVVASLERKVHDLELQLAEADADLSAISFLKGRGYQPVKRAGRPTTKAA